MVCPQQMRQQLVLDMREVSRQPVAIFCHVRCMDLLCIVHFTCTPVIIGELPSANRTPEKRSHSLAALETPSPKRR